MSKKNFNADANFTLFWHFYVFDTIDDYTIIDRL